MAGWLERCLERSPDVRVTARAPHRPPQSLSLGRPHRRGTHASRHVRAPAAQTTMTLHSERIAANPDVETRAVAVVSSDAELVALGVLHDDVPEDVAVPLLADHRRAGGDQLGDFLPDQSGALDHVPGA